MNLAQKAPAIDQARAIPRRATPTVPFFYPDWLLLREIATHVRGALEKVGRGRLLDVGCGSKPYLAYRSLSITDWVGYDVPENPMADVHGYADALPFADDSFDTVICTEVLEHVSEPAVALNEIARVLKSGGHLILTAPQYFPVHEAPYDFFRYTPYALMHLSKGAGLEVLSLKPMATGLRLVAIAVNTCFNDFGKRLPGGMTWPGRAVFAPIYLATNVLAYLLSGLVPDDKNAVGTALLARKPAEDERDSSLSAAQTAETNCRRAL